MSDFLEVAGCILATGSAGAAMLAGDRRVRAVALLVALGVAFALLAGEGWDELQPLRDRPAALAAACVLGAAVVGGLAVLLRRQPLALPLLLVGTLPFRIPIDVGSDDANLLVPLYVVIAAGAIAYALGAFSDPGPRSGREPKALAIALGVGIALYAIQSAYSSDIGFATRNVGFFLVPFAAMFSLLAEVRWTPRLLGLSLAVIAGESVVFALVGVGQHLAGEIFWNPALERSNDFHFYFRVNSLFWDPNILGRYLALASVLVLGALLFTRQPRRILWLAAVLAALGLGLLFAFSQTSFISLLFGATVLAAFGISFRWALLGAPIAAVLVIAAVFVIGGTSQSEDSSREISSGRTTLIEGGTDLFKSEPLIGHGSASFSDAFAEEEDINNRKTTISHNEPVTVAAEQGLIGLLAYAALVIVALWVLLSGMRSVAPGLGGGALADPWGDGDSAAVVARIALLAAFVALLIHTVGYGGYLTDPLTWAILAIGGALAAARAPGKTAS